MPVVLVEDAVGLLASLGAGGVLAGLLVTVQDSGDEGSAADGAGADGAGGAGSVGGGGLFGGEPGTDATLVAVAEGFRVVGVWRGLVALGCLVWGLAGWGSWPRPA